jgi:hypothetical protein
MGKAIVTDSTNLSRSSSSKVGSTNGLINNYQMKSSLAHMPRTDWKLDDRVEFAMILIDVMNIIAEKINPINLKISQHRGIVAQCHSLR